MHANKIAIVVKNDLLDWQKLNVVAFLSGAVAIGLPETHGKALISASGSEYLPFLRQPVIIYAANTSGEIKRAFNRAKDRELKIGIYTDPLFTTNQESDNIAEISKVSDDQLDLVGIVLYGELRKVNKALNKLKFHK